jgi:hypothetical protein
MEEDEENNKLRSVIDEINDPVSPISGVAPPREGRWKEGQSGNPGGRPKWKPLSEALQRLADQEPRMWDELVRAHVVKAGKGDMSAMSTLWDRVEGKVAQTVGGSTETGPIKLVIEWEK